MLGMDHLTLSRRHLLSGLGTVSALAAMPAWAQGHSIHRMRGGSPIRAGFDEVSGAAIDLTVGHGPRTVQGRKGHGIAVNGSVPGPLIRLREGQNVRLNVTNTLDTDTSIHWHG
ncbi:MAG: multicopper oxidase domain-containing protein, partial [Erythrobacter sp.]